MYKLIFVAVLSLLCILSLTGCSAGSRPSLDRVPNNAELLYTYTSAQTYGRGITTDTFSNAYDTGFFVLEFLCIEGSVQKLVLKTASEEIVSNFGNQQEDAIYITDLVTESSGNYTLYFRKADNFTGEVNVYIVPGIGYSTTTAE